MDWTKPDPLLALLERFVELIKARNRLYSVQLGNHYHEKCRELCDLNFHQRATCWPVFAARRCYAVRERAVTPGTLGAEGQDNGDAKLVLTL